MIPNDRNKKGTGFTNLNRVLQASKGSRLGGQVASGVQQTGQQVRGQIGQAVNEFQTKAGQEATKYGEQAQKQRDTEIGQVVSGAEGINPNDLMKKFADYRSGEYKGPKEVQGYESLASKATEAEQLGRLGRTSGGKQELLRRFVGGKDYSLGEQKLDTALLGLTGQAGLAQAKRSTRGLTDELGREAGAARDMSKQLQQQAESFRQQTLDKLTESRNPTIEDIRLRQVAAQELEDKRAKEYESIKTLLASPDMVKSTQGLGTDETSGNQQTQTNIDLAVDRLLKSQYFSPEETKSLQQLARTSQLLGLDTASLLSGGLTETLAQNIAPSGLASQQEKDRLALLDRLSGKLGVDVGLQGAKDPYTKGQSGFQVNALEKAVKDEMERRGISLVEGLTRAMEIVNPANMINALAPTVMPYINTADNLSSTFIAPVEEASTNVWRETVTNPVNAVIKTPGTTASNIVESGGKAVKDFVAAVCFGPDTEFLMANGKYKKVKDIKVNEEVALGGKVVTIGQGVTNDLYQYGNVKVTGNHAVYENGEWIRVKDSKKAYPIGKEKEIIYPVGTESHLLVTKGQVWADVFEIKNFKSDDLQYNIDVLNSNKPRNRKLDRFLNEYFEKDPNEFEKIKTPF